MTITYNKEQHATAKSKGMVMVTVGYDGGYAKLDGANFQGPVTIEEAKAVSNFFYDLIEGKFKKG